MRSNRSERLAEAVTQGEELFDLCLVVGAWLNGEPTKMGSTVAVALTFETGCAARRGVPPLHHELARTLRQLADAIEKEAGELGVECSMRIELSREAGRP